MMKKLLLSIGFGLLASVGVFAQSTDDAILDVSYPASVAPGETISIDVSYETTVTTWFRVVFGEAEEASNNYADWDNGAFGVNSWGKIGADVAPTNGPTNQTLTFTVPAGVPSTATAATNGNIIKMTVWLMDASLPDENIARTWHPITVAAAANSAKINSFSYPAEAGIGTDITIDYNYTSDFEESKPLIATLVTAAIGGQVNWRLTAGYLDVAATLVKGENVDGTITFNVNATEALLSTELAEGEEWRILLKLNDVEYKNGPAINIIASPEVIDFMAVTTLSSTEVDRSQTLTVNYEYSTTMDAVLEFSIMKFQNEYTPYGTATPEDPNIIVSDVVYVVDVAASTEPGVKTQGEPVVLTITNDAIYSNTFTGTDNYRVVAKLSHGTATTNTYKLQATKGILILPADAVFGNVESASFTAFPNPVSGEAVNFSTEISNVVVYDFTGNVVATEAAATSLNTSNLKSGIYMISSDQGTLKVAVK